MKRGDAKSLTRSGRSTGRYALPFLKIGRKVRYRRADLLAWLEKRVRESGATA